MWFDEQNNLQTFNARVKIYANGRELSIRRVDGQRLPFEYAPTPVGGWEKPFGYVLNNYTEEKFFKVPLIIVVQKKVATDDFCKAMGWEQIPLKVQATNPRGRNTRRLGYQYGSVKLDFGFIRQSCDKAEIQGDNIVELQ